MDQDEIIRRFVAKYNDCQDGNYQITRWPDREDRNNRACDAYAEAPQAQPLAIEHTNVETFQGQLLDSARFMRVIGELEAELKDAFDCHVTLTVPTFAVRPGTDWQLIKAQLRDWLLAAIPAQQSGRTKHQIPNIPFEIALEVDRDERMSHWFGVLRWVPPDLNDYHQLTDSVQRALTNKNDQLRVYRLAGGRTILILESQDIALVSPAMLYKAFLRARNRAATENIDEVWVANTYQDYCGLDCYQAAESIMDVANPENLMLGPQHTDYWNEVLAEEEHGAG